MSFCLQHTTDIPIKIKLVIYEVISRFEDPAFTFPERFVQKTPEEVMAMRRRRRRSSSRRRRRSKSAQLRQMLQQGDVLKMPKPEPSETRIEALKSKTGNAISDTRVRYQGVTPMTELTANETVGVRVNGEGGVARDGATKTVTLSDTPVRVPIAVQSEYTLPTHNQEELTVPVERVRRMSENEAVYRARQKEQEIHDKKLLIAEAVGAIDATTMHRTAYERSHEIPVAERVLKQVHYNTEYHGGEKPLLPFISPTKMRVMEKINLQSQHQQFIIDMLDRSDVKPQLFDSEELIVPCDDESTAGEKIDYRQRIYNCNPPLPPIRPCINKPMPSYSKLKNRAPGRLPLNLKMVENQQRYERDGRVTELEAVPHATPNLPEDDEDEFPVIGPLKTTLKSFKVHKQVSKRPRWRPPTWKIEMLKEVKKLTGKVQRKTEIIHMLEELLERRFLPRITNMLTRDFPDPYKPPGFTEKVKMSELEFTLKPHHIDPELPPNTFKKPGVAEFRKSLIQACSQFVVRKEMATYNIGPYYSTMTSVTITRKPGLPPWGPYAHMYHEAHATGHGEQVPVKGNAAKMPLPTINVKSVSRSGRTTPNYDVNFSQSQQSDGSGRQSRSRKSIATKSKTSSLESRASIKTASRCSTLSTKTTSKQSSSTNRKVSSATTASDKSAKPASSSREDLTTTKKRATTRRYKPPSRAVVVRCNNSGTTHFMNMPTWDEQESTESISSNGAPCVTLSKIKRL